jgi:hypothetical protein
MNQNETATPLKPGAILLEYVVTMSGVVGQGTAPDQGEPA